jgi:Holliday junction resolvase RusA-like endonuclease
MKQQLVINNWLPDLNDYIKHERANKFIGASIKKEWTTLVAVESRKQKLKEMVLPISLRFLWVVPDKRRDKDNIIFTQKFILDGLVKAGIIKNDGFDAIDDTDYDFEVDRSLKKTKVIVDMYD